MHVTGILTKFSDKPLVPSPEELVGHFFKRFTKKDKPSGNVSLLYISGVTDAPRRILHKQNIRVPTKPLKTPQRMSPSPKHRVPPEQRTVYSPNISCVHYHTIMHATHFLLT